MSFYNSDMNSSSSSSISLSSSSTVLKVDPRGRPYHFTRKYYTSNGLKMRCNYCSTLVRNRPGGKMKTHLANCQKFLAQASEKEIKCLKIKQSSITPFLHNTLFSKTCANTFLAEAIISGGIPAKFLDNKYFKKFINYCRPGYNGMGRTCFTENYLMNICAEASSTMMQAIHEATYVTVSVDGWSTRGKQSLALLVSPIQIRSFLLMQSL